MAPSKAFGKYLPIAELGRGGMAVVYLAASQGPRGFSKLVVIKDLKQDHSQDAEFAAMFVDEARLAARLNHPNIVQTYEVEEQGGHFFMVMEYLEGQPLSNIRVRLAQLGGQLRDHLVRVLCSVLEALHYAHDLADYDGTRLNVVHRDVSPHNVIITYGGDVKLVDFGIAKAADSSAQTRTGVIKGKLAYMSPEQAFGNPVDRRTDVFAVGVMLWEAITGQRMWKGNAEGAIAHRLNTGDIPKLPEDVPAHLKSICERALAPRADDRFATAAAMRQELETYLASLTRKPVARDFGSLVSTAFNDERTHIAALVEHQMRTLRHGPPNPDEVLTIELPRIEMALASVMPPGNTAANTAASQASGTPMTASRAVPGTRASVRGYPLLWLVLGGVALVVLGAAATTAIMAPWSEARSQAPAAPEPSTRAPDASR